MKQVRLIRTIRLDEKKSARKRMGLSWWYAAFSMNTPNKKKIMAGGIKSRILKRIVFKPVGYP
jgi:hypothetical protein